MKNKKRTKARSALIASVEELISIVGTSPEYAKKQIAYFQEALAESEVPCRSGNELMWALQDAWQSGFYVDWKDRENFIGSVDAFCEEQGIKIDWGTSDPFADEFLDSTDIPSLMQLAWVQLAAQGWTLWEWETGMDSYSGWISRSIDDPKIYAIARQLQEDFRPAVSLNAAAREGNTKKVKELLAAKAFPDEPDGYGWTPLMWAAHQGNKKMVTLLLAAGAQVDLANKDGWTALHNTVEDEDVPSRDYPEIAKLLIEAGADVNRKKADGMTALAIAARAAKPKTFAALLAANADVNAASNEGWTPLLNAVDRGDLDMVERLLASNADVNAANDDGWTPLHMAANTGDYPAIAEVLIAAGADLHARTQSGKTPLNIAAVNQKSGTLAVLLKAKADPDSQDDSEWTPLMDAVNFGNQEMVEVLLAAGANVNITNGEGWVPLHFTVADEDNREQDYAKIAALLVNAGADINARTKKGLTPLALAVRTAKPRTFAFLLSANADPDVADEKGWTPLMYAVDAAQDLFAKALVLGVRANVNIASIEGLTALHIAAEASSKSDNELADIARLLLTMGANVDARDKRGFTPLILAEQNGKQRVVEVFDREGAGKKNRTRP